MDSHRREGEAEATSRNPQDERPRSDENQSAEDSPINPTIVNNYVLIQWQEATQPPLDDEAEMEAEIDAEIRASLARQAVVIRDIRRLRAEWVFALVTGVPATAEEARRKAASMARAEREGCYPSLIGASSWGSIGFGMQVPGSSFETGSVVTLSDSSSCGSSVGRDRGSGSRRRWPAGDEGRGRSRYRSRFGRSSPAIYYHRGSHGEREFHASERMGSVSTMRSLLSPPP